MVIKVTNLREFQKGTAAAKARLEGTVTAKYKKFVTRVFTDLVTHSPQWSGELAANWSVITTHQGVPSRQYWKYKPPVRQMGDKEAVNFALEGSKPVIASLRWNVKVSFVNPTPYSSELEAHPEKLRPVNLVDGQVVLARYIAQKYSRGNVKLNNE